jgi:hypothetical protein
MLQSRNRCEWRSSATLHALGHSTCSVRKVLGLLLPSRIIAGKAKGLMMFVEGSFGGPFRGRWTLQEGCYSCTTQWTNGRMKLYIEVMQDMLINVIFLMLLGNHASLTTLSPSYLPIECKGCVKVHLQQLVCWHIYQSYVPRRKIR